MKVIKFLLLLTAALAFSPNQLPYIETNLTKDETRARIIANYLKKDGENGERAARCIYGTVADMDGEQFWMDNQWQKMGARRITLQDYETYIYGGKSKKPWLLFFGRTPYGGPDGDFNAAFMLWKKSVCMIEAFEGNINVGFVDTWLEEYVREAFDPEVQRLGKNAPFVVFIKDGIAYMMPQINHNLSALVRLVES